MEKKRWVLILMALCLALVFSVTSVEARGSCDADGDGFVKDTRKCRKLIGEPGIDGIDLNDRDCAIPEEDGCDNGGGGGSDDRVPYNVEIGGSLGGNVRGVNQSGGNNDTWFGPHPSRKSIGRGFRSGPVFELDMSYFIDFFNTSVSPWGPRGTGCFGSDPVRLFPQAHVKRGGGGRAEGHLWFIGCTHEGREFNGDCSGDVVQYVIKWFGSFDYPEFGVDWPPAAGDTNHVRMIDWVIEREGQAVVSSSCLGGEVDGEVVGEEEGIPDFEVFIDVTPQ